jgi:hypothetical protein
VRATRLTSLVNHVLRLHHEGANLFSNLEIARLQVIPQFLVENAFIRAEAHGPSEIKIVVGIDDRWSYPAEDGGSIHELKRFWKSNSVCMVSDVTAQAWPRRA